MYQKNYTSYFNKRGPGYSPQSASKFGNGTRKFGSGTKRPVKHFTDLDVYQKALEASVFVTKNIGEKSALDSNSETTVLIGTREYIIKNMIALALSIPHQIAESHSMRFGSSQQCLVLLDKVMLNCNRMVVFLEQARDICETGLETDQFEEQTKKYFFIRQKVLNLQRVWRKYIDSDNQERSVSDGANSSGRRS
jgi:hypothetical protein